MDCEGWLRNLICVLCVPLQTELGAFDPERYRREIAENAVNFARSDDVLTLTFDCPSDRLEVMRSYLEERTNQGELHYGMHKSDHAVMTCLVASIQTSTRPLCGRRRWRLRQGRNGA